MKIKVMPFLQKKGNRVAKGAIEFDTGILEGMMLIGFSICEDGKNQLSVMFPSASRSARFANKSTPVNTRPFYFLHGSPDKIERLENAILDVYESMTGFNRPIIVAPTAEQIETHNLPHIK